MNLKKRWKRRRRKKNLVNSCAFSTYQFLKGSFFPLVVLLSDSMRFLSYTSYFSLLFPNPSVFKIIWYGQCLCPRFLLMAMSEHSLEQLLNDHVACSFWTISPCFWIITFSFINPPNSSNLYSHMYTLDFKNIYVHIHIHVYVSVYISIDR